MTGYPWATGDALLAADLNAAIANAGGNDSYTADGGTTPRTAQHRAGSFLTVEDFGAVGDGTADDSNAFDAYAAYLRTQFAASKPQMCWALGFGRFYYVSRSVNLTGFSHFRFEGNHSKILCGDLTHPFIDMLGSDNCTMANVRLIGGTQANPGVTGIIYGVYNNLGGGHPGMTFENVTVDVFCSRAAVQNSGSETNLIQNPIFINRYSSGTPGSSYVLIMDGTNHWPLSSRYVTDARTANTYFSFLGIFVTAGALQHVGDGSVLWDGGGSQHHYRGTYMQVLQAVPIAVLAVSADFPVKHDFIFETTSETAPSCVFSITGATIIDMAGFIMPMEFTAVSSTGAVFRAESDVTLVRITDAHLTLPYWVNAGSKLFNTPAKFTLTGDLSILHAYHSHYNAPAAGFVRFLTDDSTGFTPSVYGSVGDATGNGSSVSAASALFGGTLYAGGAATLAGTVGFNGTAPIAKRTGWGAPTGTATRSAFVTGSVTLPTLAEHVKALIDDLTAYGLIGP